VKNKSLAKDLVFTLIVEGNVYKNIGDYEKVIEIYNEYLKLAKKQNDHHLWVIVSNNKANIYRREGNHDEAIKNHNLEKDKILILGNIGLVYKEQKDYETALFYYE
jgi:tetratricopeptide (TPR) repeat protein